MTTTPSQPPESFLGSRIPPPPVDALKGVQALLSRLRAEASGSTSPSRKARLLYEVAEIEERASDEGAAARDYLAAYNADAEFREPIEALLRLLERRRSLRNLGKLVDTIARAAATPDEDVRAKTMRAFFLEDVGGDVQGAKNAAIEATEVAGASPAEKAMAWLTTEMIAARLSDGTTRVQALSKRPETTSDPTWRALLLLDAARLQAAAGDIDAALELVARSRAEGAGATFVAAVAEERLARAALTSATGGDSEEAGRRSGVLADALEAQASLIEEAMADGARGDTLGVPLWTRALVYVVDACLRAADLRSRAGDAALAKGLLDRASRAIERAESNDPSLGIAVLDARIRIAERDGDASLSAQLAEARLAKYPDEDGGAIAALTMRIAELAASEGDVPRALTALASAVAKDPTCVPARALQLDLLADDDPAEFALQLEALADHLPTEDGRARALLLAAWVWGARANDAPAARSALGQSSLAGTPSETVAHVSRTLASLAGDATWYEEATKRLLADGASEAERPMLWLELARARFGRGDEDGGRGALREISACAGGEWLGRALEAFLPSSSPATTSPRAREALDELAARPQPEDVARGLVLMAAMRAHRGGDIDGARMRLQTLLSKRGDDVLAATYLADLERSRGARDEAARVVEFCAAATSDPELAAALHLEAALERWRQGDRSTAVASLEAAVDAAPEAARAVLAWAARGVDVDDPNARRRAIARALDAGGDEATLQLERFGVELATGNDEDARTALDAALSCEDEAPSLAAALAQVAWSPIDDEPEIMVAALERVSSAGPDAHVIALAEAHRCAVAARDPSRALDASRAWFEAGGGLTAAIEWLAATMMIADAQGADAELAARKALAAEVPGDLREALVASSAILHSAATPADLAPLIVGSSDAVRLVNLELAPPGCDPRRRIAALRDLDGALGPDAEADAASLSGWSWLVEGNAAEAMLAFEHATTVHADDLGAWEGLRTAAEMTNDTATRAGACEALGSLCKDDARAARFWEQAGLAFVEMGFEERAEAAFFQSFARDASRTTAFDRLFRRVRARKEGDLLLELVGRRLAVCDEPTEIAKLFWEQARVLREKGDQEGALKALENVTMLEPDHVGALALTGEIAIRRGKFQEAADALARLALLDAAPAKNRVTAGVAAVDIFENKLDRFDRALEILLALHRAKLSTLPVRERLARAAARTGSWREATSILEELMHERPEPDGRIEAARLAMAIHRDRLDDPNGAAVAVVKLLEESPVDGEAIDMLLAIDVSAQDRARLLANARRVLVDSLQRRIDLPSVKRLAKTARALGDEALQQIALAVAIVLGGHDAALEQQFAQVSGRKPRAPQIALSEAILKQVMDPGDRGPVARLFAALGPTIAEALGPSLTGCGVTKKDRIDPRSGIALRNEIAAWAGAFGIMEFDLYVGGKDPLDVQGVPGDPPALVVGAGVNAPLAPATRARVARELLAMARGSSITRHRDDTTIAAIVVAACNLAEVKVDAPSYAVLADVERHLAKAIARKTKKLLPELCQAVVSSNADARAWSKRALASHARVATLASGDVGIALMDALGEPQERLPAIAKSDPRAEELIRFALSPAYLELRRALGLEGGGG
jgi:tetratricopeptide (TPR) repeat protein